MKIPDHPPTLTGRRLLLEALAERHAADLSRAAAPNTWDYMLTVPGGDTAEAFVEYIRQVQQPGVLAFAQVDRESGIAVGVTTFLDIRPSHRGLEIGNTWIGPAWQGTYVNPEAKFLLLRYAFEELAAVRVQLKCDARNAASQRAIAKLGAQREGILRRHMVLPDGFIRDTVMFSILDREWPEVQAGLIARLGYTP